MTRRLDIDINATVSRARTTALRQQRAEKYVTYAENNSNSNNSNNNNRKKLTDV